MRLRNSVMVTALLLGASACAGRTSSTGANAAPATSAESIEQQIRRLDAGWANAYAVHDTAFALQLLAPDIVITSTDGTLKTRDVEMGDIRESPGFVMEYFRTSDVVVKVLDGAAVVAGRAEWKFTNQGRPSVVARRYTAVYSRGGPLGWRMVAIQLGRAP